MTLEVSTEHNGDIGQNASTVNSFHCTQVVETTEKDVNVVCIRWLQDMSEVSSAWTSLDAGFQPSGSYSGPAAAQQSAAVGVRVSCSTAIVCSWCWGQPAATWRPAAVGVGGKAAALNQLQYVFGPVAARQSTAAAVGVGGQAAARQSAAVGVGCG